MKPQFIQKICIKIIEFIEYILNNRNLLFLFNILSLPNFSFDLSNINLIFFKKRFRFYKNVNFSCTRKVFCSKNKVYNSERNLFSKVYNSEKVDLNYNNCNSDISKNDFNLNNKVSNKERNLNNNKNIFKSDFSKNDFNNKNISNNKICSNIKLDNTTDTIFNITTTNIVPSNITTNINEEDSNNNTTNNKLDSTTDIVSNITTTNIKLDNITNIKLNNTSNIVPSINTSPQYKYTINTYKILSYIILITTNIFPIILFYKIFHLLIPKINIAFIADGNRRYLKKHNKNIQQTKQKGISKINEIINLCTKLNLKEVSFFCFSINNFKRPTIEIENILQIFKYNKTITNCKIKIYGNLNLLPKNIAINLVELEQRTEINKGIIVNLFIAYSTNDEINSYIRFNKKVDLIVRTSGEKRLSDFLVLNVCNGARVLFIDCLWPEVSVCHVLLVLIMYRLENLFFK